MDMSVSIGLLDRSVKESALIITHQPRFQKNGPHRRKIPSDEVRTAIELNPPLYRKFALLVLLNKYDVLGMVHDPMLIQPAVQEIENLGEKKTHSQKKIKRKIVFSDLRNPPKSFTLLFGEVAKFRTLTKAEEQWGRNGEGAEHCLPQAT